MKLWQSEARPLPVLVRPLSGETIPSFTRRLSEANDLNSTTILRAIGAIQSTTGRHLLERDAVINDQALERLQTYSAIPAHRLQYALPALRSGHPYAAQVNPLPTDVPALRCYIPYPPAQRPCSSCASRANAAHQTASALVRPTTDPWICRTHRRWLGATFSAGGQLDITNTGTTITAHRRYQRLLKHHDHELVTRSLHDAMWITSNWATSRHGLYPDLPIRWANRAETLATATSSAHPAIRFPEAVDLTEILTDLNWRRHVAMVPTWNLDPFYRRVGIRLQQPRSRTQLWATDSLKDWAASHRHRYAHIREQFLTETKHLAAHPRPFPEIRHFK